MAKVKKEMQEAINEAYDKPNFYARCISSAGDVPTPDEFIAYAANRVSILKGKK